MVWENERCQPVYVDFSVLEHSYYLSSGYCVIWLCVHNMLQLVRRTMISRKKFDFKHLLKSVIKKVKGSRDRPGMAQRVPGGWGSQISMTFGTWRWWGQPHTPAAFTPRIYSWYSFSQGVESTPGTWYGWKGYVTEKSNGTTGDQSRDCPTSSAAP